MAWIDDVVAAFRMLDGEATLAEVYEKIPEVRAVPLPAEWHAIVRREIQNHSRDSKTFAGLRGQSLFSHVGRGRWRLDGLPLTLAPLLDDKTADIEGFNPKDISDAREAILRSVVVRRGQQAFRNRLLQAYRSTCAVSGCTVLSVLEAAHISPYRVKKTNHVTNGLLLRADIHTLFDCRVIGVDPTTSEIVVAPQLQASEYGQYHRKALSKPVSPNQAPNLIALREQFRECGFQSDWPADGANSPG